MRIPLVRGRYFDDRDTADSPRDDHRRRAARREVLARAGPGRAPDVPARERGGGAWRPTDKTGWLTVVGVVGEVKQDGLVTAKTPVGAYYLPMTQETVRPITFTLRCGAATRALASPLRAAIGAASIPNCRSSR